MVLRIFIVFSFLQIAGAADSKYFTKVKDLTSGVNDTFVAVATGSVDTWSKLSTPQAKRVLNKLASSGDTLYEENKLLQIEVEKHVRDNTGKDFKISPRIKKLQHQASDMANKLEKFRHEVDQAVGTTEHKRSNTKVAMNYKAEMLADVETSWNNGQYQDANTSLRDAMEELQKAQNGIACLQKSIDARETKCDKNTLAPIEKEKQ